MPQLDVTTYPSQLFWLFVTFLALYFILSNFVIPKVSHFILERTEAIDGKLREASLLRQEAELLLNEYEAVLSNSRNEARHRYMEVAGQVSKKMAKKQKEMVEVIAERIRMAEQDMYRSRLGLIKELQPQAIDVAQDILLKLTGEKVAINELKKYQREA